jgi:hypothetical protein
MLVVCNGMMRAGSTLQYNLARALVGKLGLGTGEGYFESGEFSALEERLNQWVEDEAFHVVKMHALHPRVADMSTGGSMRVCYVYRDIRDVAASAKRIWGMRGPKLLQSLEEAIETFYEVTSIPNVLSQKYEDLVGDLAGAITELALFLGSEVPANVISSVVEECSVDSAKVLTDDMRRRPFVRLRGLLRRLGFSAKAVYDRDTLLHPDHISKSRGESGIWRQILDQEESDTVSERYAGWLAKQGYEV